MKNIPIHRKYLTTEISFKYKVYTFYGHQDKNIFGASCNLGKS